MIIKARDMNKAQITHSFCTWCDYRRYVLGETYWGCGLPAEKLDELCLYRQAIRKEEKEEKEAGHVH